MDKCIENLLSEKGKCKMDGAECSKFGCIYDYYEEIDEEEKE